MATKLLAKPPGSVSPGHIKGVLFGKPGVGKTWTALSFPACYFLDVENGARLSHYTDRLVNSGGVYMGAEDGSQDFETVINQVIALCTEKHAFKTLVIDSITKLFELEIAREAERLGSKDAFGASKKPAIAHMRRLVVWLGRLQMNVWLIAHETSEWGVVDGQRTEIGKVPSIWPTLIHELDLTLQVRMHTAKRRDAAVYKSRLLGFPANDVIILQDGVDKGYESIAERFGKDFIEAKATQIILATSDQIEQITKLFAALNLSEDQISKGLSRRNAESIAELSMDDAAKIITELRSKIEV
jgi:hypothetical protein